MGLIIWLLSGLIGFGIYKYSESVFERKREYISFTYSDIGYMLLSMGMGLIALVVGLFFAAYFFFDNKGDDEVFRIERKDK